MIRRVLRALGITAIWQCTQCDTNNADDALTCQICGLR